MRAVIILYAVKALSRLPLPIVRYLGLILGWLFFLVPNRERHNARVNIALCYPQLAPGQQRRLVRRSLIENARSLLEMPGFWRGSVQRSLRLIQPGEAPVVLRQLLQRGKGVIVAVPHLGAWEIPIHYIARISPVTVLYRPPREQVLEQLILEGRSRGGATPVPTNAAGVKALYEALRRNEIVLILPDQQPRHRTSGSGVFAPFFGVPALTMVLINRLARKTDAAVVFGFCERLAGGEGYRLHAMPAPEGIVDADPEIAATALNLGVENCVRRCPEQYQWSYKRFSVRPDGARSPYKKPL